MAGVSLPFQGEGRAISRCFLSPVGALTEALEVVSKGLPGPVDSAVAEPLSPGAPPPHQPQ